MNEALIRELKSTVGKQEKYIRGVLDLLEEGNTIPFIARYRKEMTGGMDEQEIKAIHDRFSYLQSLEKRKSEVIRRIDEQGLLTEQLEQDIMKQTVLNRVEDLYRPFKQKKKTRATEAKRKGLDGLARVILEQQAEDVEAQAGNFLNDEVETVEEAIKGAQDIIAEEISDNPKYRNYILKVFRESADLTTRKKKNAEDQTGVFEMYYSYAEPIDKTVPHRVLAINRGENTGVLAVKFDYDNDRFKRYIGNQVLKEKSTTAMYMRAAIEDSLKRLIVPSIEREVRQNLTESSEKHAVHIFEENLKRLLLQPPLKGHVILGVDPAFRTGCKLAVINESGQFLYKGVIYPHPPQGKVDQARKVIMDIIADYDVTLLAIGNGTASRETELFISEIVNTENLDVQFIIVNEAGASVYSASDVAREEFPDFNVEERSAVSIARRVQDPLSELVKIDSKAIGIGQYQHDVNQKFLDESLNFVVETSVNQVGVNVNTASHILLQHVAGLSPAISRNIVKYREEQSAFRSREEIKKVPRLGNKTYEQCIGFLRVFDGDEPLDRTPIHPERYKETYRLLEFLGMGRSDIGTEALISAVDKLDLDQTAQDLAIGVPTLKDIIDSLKAPTRDIRDDYEVPMLKSDVLKMEDLKEGMKLSGTVRNVTDFGAFVDIGVKQDGLVHISKMTSKFIKHPMEVVSVGDIVDVTVTGVDTDKGRISLSMK
ncbi:RNA-binding transcriptional accessory protein [Salinicoccus sp. ID82-1]|uniref:Tex family protein n=1 Tax=Salinicoccus sp. ID82-1 TaxID=2820269 RepID=UPI001F37E5D7|nr:Tex family protein [Salinicoccus sp. ID82-1]MCG1009929.1 RNA-binding transcriptional accessory protein [Salinicoccus sp. ID82-1]